jgi:acyl-CoA synthetase (AMP-forming)/AMP-acid ligase II
MNTAEFLQISSAVVPEREALVCGEQRITYMDMAMRVNRLANALLVRGVRQGTKVAVMALNSPQYVEAYYASAKIGAVFVPLNYRAKREETVHMLNNSEASLLFVGERYVDLMKSLQPEIPGVKDLVCIEGRVEGMPSYDDLLAAGSDEEMFVPIEESDATVLMYTSGTTALPKGVILTYLTLSVYVVNTMSPADPELPLEVTLLSVPVYHVAGLTAIMSSIWGGRKLVILPQFEPSLWLEAVQKEGVTHSFVVPTMLKRVMEHPDFDKHDLSSLQLITYGAAPMPYEVVRKAVDVFKCGLMNAYGQTESTSTMTYLGPEDHRIEGTGEEKEKKLQRLRSVGRPMDDVDVAIIGPKGNVLGPGREGEICVRGARIMREYYGQAEATAAAIVDGWLHTGDVGYLDEDGYLFMTGRTKDLIIRGGENISPGEIESCLEEHPKVAEAAVIGVPDVEWGEKVMALLVLRPGEKMIEEEVIQYCKGRLASFKAPSAVAFVEELPRNPLGKVLKTDLRKTYGRPA